MLQQATMLYDVLSKWINDLTERTDKVQQIKKTIRYAAEASLYLNNHIRRHTFAPLLKTDLFLLNIPLIQPSTVLLSRCNCAFLMKCNKGLLLTFLDVNPRCFPTNWPQTVTPPSTYLFVVSFIVDFLFSKHFALTPLSWLTYCFYRLLSLSIFCTEPLL